MLFSRPVEKCRMLLLPDIHSGDATMQSGLSLND